MHFYRPLNTIKALTFDLDDTIYDNTEVMVQAEAAFIDCLNQIEGIDNITLDDFNTTKRSMLINDPEIYHDVVAWRVAAIKLFLLEKGIAKQNINQLAQDAMERFIFWRHKITVPETSLLLLDKLAEKYPLVAITNGNADVEKIGLGHYFKFALRGGVDVRSKPFPEIFNQAADKLNLRSSAVLHVGDNLYTDVLGAINSNMQACWLNILGRDIYQQQDARVLPHIEITKLSELNNLL